MKRELICSRKEDEAILCGCGEDEDEDDADGNDAIVLLLRSSLLLLFNCLSWWVVRGVTLCFKQ